MNSPDSDLVAAWLRYQADQEEKGTEDPDWWAVSDLQDIFFDDADRAWRITVELARESHADWQTVMIGCSILEDLLRENPDRYLPLLESEGHSNPKLIAAAAHVWASEPIHARLDAILRRYGHERR